MSESAHDAIMAFPEFITECRGDISVKVKNSQYYLKNNVFAHILYCTESLVEAF